MIGLVVKGMVLGWLSRGVSVVEVVGLYRVWCWVGYQGVCLLSRL